MGITNQAWFAFAKCAQPQPFTYDHLGNRLTFVDRDASSSARRSFDAPTRRRLQLTLQPRLMHGQFMESRATINYHADYVAV